MKILAGSVSIVWLGLLMGCQPAADWSFSTEAVAGQTSAAVSGASVTDVSPAVHKKEVPAAVSTTESSGVLEITGQTRPVPGRVAAVSTVVLHPVTRLLVAPGERVKAGQPLVELDADEPEAEVRAKQATVAELRAGLARLKALPRTEERAEARATLEGAQITAKAAREYLERIHELHTQDAVSSRQHIEAHTASLKSAADERAAQAHLDHLLKQPIEHEISEQEARIAVAVAELEAHEAELEHYVIHSPIDGIVSWLDVPLGAVSRPGTSSWGEILDLREIDVRCELSAEQVDRVALDQPVEVRQPHSASTRWLGKVVFIGAAADARTGLIPVVARIAEAREQLRCYTSVTARFGAMTAAVNASDDAGEERPVAQATAVAD